MTLMDDLLRQLASKLRSRTDMRRVSPARQDETKQSGRVRTSDNYSLPCAGCPFVRKGECSISPPR